MPSNADQFKRTFCIPSGSIYLEECPAQPKLPIYLIIFGAFALFLCFSHFILECGRVEYEQLDEEERMTWLNCFLGQFSILVHVFLFAWFITGSVWVYRVYSPNFEERTNPSYCQYTIYQFAFWFTNSIYIVVAALITFLIVYLIWRTCISPDYL